MQNKFTLNYTIKLKKRGMYHRYINGQGPGPDDSQ